MSPLQQFQDAFAQALLDPQAAPLETVAGLVGQPGFAVYRNSVFKGCIDALQANFPAVVPLLGEDAFRAMAALYVREHPPTQATLLYYGADFAGFLEGFGVAPEGPCPVQVAHLDRLWTESHAAHDGDVLPAQALAMVPPQALGGAVLHPHPATRWALADPLIAAAWWAGRGITAPETLHEGVLLTRPLGAVQAGSIGPGAVAFLDQCTQGLPLATAAQAAMTAQPDTDFAQLAATLLGAGAFARLDHESVFADASECTDAI